MSSSLYLLVHSSQPMFKIGIANNVQQRARLLEKYWGDLDDNKSCVVDFKTRRQAADMERTLHSFFKNYNITDHSSGEGYTEWFRSECFDNVKSEIDRITNLYFNGECCLKSGLPRIEKLPSPRRAYVYPSKEERERREQEEWHNKMLKNAETWTAFKSWIEFNRGSIVFAYPHKEFCWYFIEGNKAEWDALVASPIIIDLPNGAVNLYDYAEYMHDKDSDRRRIVVDIYKSGLLLEHKETQYIYNELSEITDSIIGNPGETKWAPEWAVKWSVGRFLENRIKEEGM